jgi:hypothetical protein
VNISKENIAYLRRNRPPLLLFSWAVCKARKSCRRTKI